MPARVNQITVQELKSLRDKNEEHVLIDVREPDEQKICSIGGELIPLKQIEENLDRIPKDKKVIIHCHSGGRSSRVIQHLQDKHGFTNLYNLKGGILAWIEEIDPTLQSY